MFLWEEKKSIKIFCREVMFWFYPSPSHFLFLRKKKGVFLKIKPHWETRRKHVYPFTIHYLPLLVRSSAENKHSDSPEARDAS